MGVFLHLGTTSWLKRRRVALARRDVIRDVDVKRRGSGATVDAGAMEIVIRSLGLFRLLLLRIYLVVIVLIGLNVFVI
jgi:hypothetical protein